ncbi:hypothetical protein RND81_06G039000 [Saponaria officinalis]|uniref:Leucine-rich repeat-containing N-terminal plant-type domain-containing protein n=1 Tax=Saponaria officinalis TaxID=3572 RepID=A0AAW1K730_SAPOF
MLTFTTTTLIRPCHHSISAKSGENDYVSLMLALKNNFNPPESLGWVEPDPCNWALVGCSDDKRVTPYSNWAPKPKWVDQCLMKMGLILTGVGDKCQVMRLWSSENYKCLEEYSLSDLAPLVDFDFDESKVVGLVGTRICIWRRRGNRSIFPSREGTFPKGLCMRYMDPEAAVGCEDGTVRVFDMYSRSCSRIIRRHSAPVTCLALGEDQLIISGSSLGSVAVYGVSSDLL